MPVFPYHSSRRSSLSLRSALWITPLTVLLAMLSISAFTGFWPWSDNPYSSYILQAQSWLSGRLDLGQDYPWLELAIRDGKYYVSFPPFPSYVLLPFVAVLGENAPDTLIAWTVTLIGVATAVRLFRLLGASVRSSVFWSLFLYLGSGYLFIGQTSWVWFIAQTMAFTLSLLSLTCAL